MAKENKTRDTIDAVTGLVKAVPIYQDLVQPAAKEVGVGLQKTVLLALAPISGMVWGYDKIKEFVATSVARRLQNTPQEKIITPSPQVAGPALEALKYSGHAESLREMYAKLLATAMDADKAKSAHPAFVEVIRQLTPDEAKICPLFSREIYFPLITVKTLYEGGGERDLIKHFSLIGQQAGCTFPDLTQPYLDNLCRLGLTEIPPLISMSDKSVYDKLKTYPSIVLQLEKLKKDNRAFNIFEEVLTVTNFGIQFCNACIDPDIKVSK